MLVKFAYRIPVLHGSENLQDKLSLGLFAVKGDSAVAVTCVSAAWSRDTPCR